MHDIKKQSIDIDSRDIVEAKIGPRSVVATSPDKLEECKWELEADTEKFINAIEVSLKILCVDIVDADMISENRLSVCLGRVQCASAATKFPVWGYGKSNLHICNPKHHFKGMSHDIMIYPP